MEKCGALTRGIICSCPVLCLKCKDDANFGDPFRIRCDVCNHSFCRKCIIDYTICTICLDKTEQKMNDVFLQN